MRDDRIAYYANRIMGLSESNRRGELNQVLRELASEAEAVERKKQAAPHGYYARVVEGVSR